MLNDPDILGILRMQRDSIDMSYLRKWCAELGLTDVLDRACRKAGRRDEQ